VAAGFILGVAGIGSREQTAIPITVIMHESLLDHEGTLKAKDILIMAVRSDGSVAEERMTDRDGRLFRTRSVHDRTSGTKTALDEATRSKTTYHRLRLRGFEETYLIPESGISDEGELMLGKRVVRVTQKNRTSLVTRWLAPDLDYFQLRAEIALYDGEGAVRARTIRQAVEIIQGAPDPALFAIPESYFERSPSEVYAEMERLGLRPCPGCGDKVSRDASLDRIYLRYRRP
jgi:hypothetical protein